MALAQKKKKKMAELILRDISNQSLHCKVSTTILQKIQNKSWIILVIGRLVWYKLIGMLIVLQ